MMRDAQLWADLLADLDDDCGIMATLVSADEGMPFALELSLQSEGIAELLTIAYKNIQYRAAEDALTNAYHVQHGPGDSWNLSDDGTPTEDSEDEDEEDEESYEDT